MLNTDFFLRNLWYHALPSAELKPGQMLSRTYLGEPILLGRTRAGKVFALQDICPHRAVPLSCGWFDGEQVQCCYHGWKFNQGGRCTEIPSLMSEQEMDLSRFDVPSYPIRETQGNLWIYMRDRATATPQFDVPAIPGFAGKSPNLTYTVRFPCFIDHAVVGLMDPAHSPYVHRAWWWRTAALHDEIKQFEPVPYGFRMTRHQLENAGYLYNLIGGAPATEITFYLPSVRIEETTTSKYRVCNLTTVTPISEQATDVTFQFYWNMPWGWLLKPLLRPLVKAFLDQDRSVVVKQQIGLQHNPVLRLIKDSDTPARWYYQLKNEYARAMAEDRDFVSPVKPQVLRWRA
ncbi:MAG: aromatic ring-hydroxylating dioxygenase subunit alpha [Leptolyngbya sp. SIO4C1]|nr:aromatic ring-hydroxylating dioxygenase subunit alpha [Leptolyngbya sp. SIO4C1]